MPGYRAHVVGGVVAALPLLYLLRSYATPVTMVVWCACAAAGALFPDVDTKSKGQKWFYRCIIPTLMVLLLLKRLTVFIIIALMSFTPLIVNHRGLFHRLWFIVLPPLGLAGVIAWHYPRYGQGAFFAALFFAIGSVSHLVLDYGPVKMFRIKKRRRKRY